VYKAFLGILGIILRYDNWRSFVVLPTEVYTMNAFLCIYITNKPAPMSINFPRLY
jgi:hypothetical protein